uniref:Condensin complex subunit 2 n=1 Tax=Caenorhabditis japonica TaxID=281687 RepID=A0A8R1DUP3_CAEJA
MDIPSSSNVTGRRKRTVAPDEDFDPLTQSARLRQVRGTKQSNAQNLASNGLMDQVNSHVDDIVNKRKVGALNCFEYKSPLELYGIEKMVEANASIQEMAIVLESAQVILGYRVDRLHHDVRQVDSAISSGDMSRGNGTDDVHLNVENRKARKKMAITDGMNGMSDFLNQIDDEQYAENIRREALENNAEAQWNGDGEDDNGNAGEPRIDPTANSMDVDLFTQRDVFIGDLIKSLAIERAVHFQAEIAQEASAFVSADDTCHDIKDSSIDWLKTNPTFQKATKGSLDNTATSFHSLNHLGLHSPSGRTLILHPRIQDKHADDRFFTSDVTASLANNTRALLENSLSKKPAILENYLMLEVRDRPVIGRYKIMAKDVKKSTLPLAEASRERDLANLTFAEMNRFNSTDMTVIGSSDMSMLPGVRGLPLSIGDNDETIAIDAPNLNQTVSQSRVAKDEYVPPNLEALALEEALIGRIPMDPMDMDELTKIFEEKINDYNTSDFIESKVWQNGMRAEEWGKDDETSLNAVTRNTFCAGIDGWIKATDSWTNYDVVKMPVNREIKQQLEENAADEQDSYRNMVPDIGKNIFLVKSDDFMNNYPTDRFQELKIVGEELDVMKMTPGFDGEDEDVTLEQIQKEIQNRNELDMDPEPMDDMDYDASAVEVDFDDRLAAPADDDEMIERPNANNDDGHVADILFGDQLEEREQEAFDENVRQRNIEDIALGADEVPELMTGSAPEQLVGPSAEMRDEIRNIGKHDNAHWLPPEIANKERQDLLIAQRKKKEKKTKSKKVTVEEYVHYFRDISEEELEREETIVKCEKIMDEKSIFLSEQQVYLPTLGTENKPHVALDLTTLTSRVDKGGSMQYIKIKAPPSHREEVI